MVKIKIGMSLPILAGIDVEELLTDFNNNFEGDKSMKKNGEKIILSKRIQFFF